MSARRSRIARIAVTTAALALALGLAGAADAVPTKIVPGRVVSH